jgi:hypothetical protein
MRNKSYFDLIQYKTFEERYEYLRLQGVVGKETFGYNRYLNQLLYHTPEWFQCRRDVIVRDDGCDLGCDGHAITDRILIHHIVPITPDDILNRNPLVFDLSNLITTSHNTHLAIHYGDDRLLVQAPIERSPYDTCPWKL